MAMTSSQCSGNNQNNYAMTAAMQPLSSKVPAAIMASCYATTSGSTAIQGFHYYSTGTDGVQWRS